MEGKLVWHFLPFLWDSTQMQCGVCQLALQRNSGRAGCPSLASSETSAHLLETRVTPLWFVGDSDLSVPLSMGTFMSVCSYKGSLPSNNMEAQAVIFSLLGNFGVHLQALSPIPIVACSCKTCENFLIESKLLPVFQAGWNQAAAQKFGVGKKKGQADGVLLKLDFLTPGFKKNQLLDQKTFTAK